MIPEEDEDKLRTEYNSSRKFFEMKRSLTDFRKSNSENLRISREKLNINENNNDENNKIKEDKFEDLISDLSKINKSIFSKEIFIKDKENSRISISPISNTNITPNSLFNEKDSYFPPNSTESLRDKLKKKNLLKNKSNKDFLPKIDNNDLPSFKKSSSRIRNESTMTTSRKINSTSFNQSNVSSNYNASSSVNNATLSNIIYRPIATPRVSSNRTTGKEDSFDDLILKDLKELRIQSPETYQAKRTNSTYRDKRPKKQAADDDEDEDISGSDNKELNMLFTQALEYKEDPLIQDKLNTIMRNISDIREALKLKTKQRQKNNLTPSHIPHQNLVITQQEKEKDSGLFTFSKFPKSSQSDKRAPVKSIPMNSKLNIMKVKKDKFPIKLKKPDLSEGISIKNVNIKSKNNKFI